MGNQLKRKKRSSCSTKNYIIAAFFIAAILILLYEVAITFNQGYKVRNVSIFKYQPDNKDVSGSLSRIQAGVNLQHVSGVRDISTDDVGKEHIINTVHFVWCLDKTFTFTNYLSVLSVWKILQPDIIVFHYKALPKTEKYDDWFEELKRIVPSLALREIPLHWDGDDKGCGFWFGLAVIDDRGGKSELLFSFKQSDNFPLTA